MVKVIIVILSLAASYHALTFAAWLRQNANAKGAVLVCFFVLVMLFLLAI